MCNPVEVETLLAIIIWYHFWSNWYIMD